MKCHVPLQEEIVRNNNAWAIKKTETFSQQPTRQIFQTNVVWNILQKLMFKFNFVHVKGHVFL